MKLKRYLTESKSIIDVIKLLEDYCQPFIKDLMATGLTHKFLYSGRRESGKDIFKKSVRINRKPLDTPIVVHNKLDELFKKKFGVALRSSSVFVTPNYMLATEYGNDAYMIFPIGKYSIYWSEKISDLYDHINDRWITLYTSNKKPIYNNLMLYLSDPMSTGLSEEELTDPKNKKIIKSELNKIINTYKKNDLKGLFSVSNSRREAMLVCKEYFMVNISYRSDLNKYFEKRDDYINNTELLMKDLIEIY